ncbi:MAG: hypothetical protein IIA87_03670 [Nanoarchaeota archaeon]|nr:hypothetical protein [Nanoarchaeota archaeon]
MADTLSTIGSISNHLFTIFPDLPSGFSGLVLLEIADMARQHVANFTGQNIGSNGIGDSFQSAILDFAKADLIDLINAQQGGEEVKLGELSFKDTGEAISAEQYRMLGEMKLNALGKDYKVVQALS